MSLIHDVLRDLDQRQAPAEQGNAVPAALQSSAATRRRPRWVLPVIAGAGLIAASVAFWWLYLPAAHPIHVHSVAEPGSPPVSPATATPPPSAALASAPTGQEPMMQTPAAASLSTKAALLRALAAAAPGAPLSRPAPSAALPPPRAAPTAAPTPIPATRQADRAPPAAEPASSGFGSTREQALALYQSAQSLEGVDAGAAQEKYREALHLNPGLVAARLRLAEDLWSAGERDAAMDILRAGLGLDPDNGPLALLQARFLAATEHPAEALTILLALRPAPVGNADYYGMIGTLAQQTGHLPMAREAFANALLLAPDNVRWRMGMGITLALQGKNAARPYLEQALAAIPAQSGVARYLESLLRNLPGSSSPPSP
ncbi:MAG: tetratricopeptide repeat protein [Acidithiobacillus sp.]